MNSISRCLMGLTIAAAAAVSLTAQVRQSYKGFEITIQSVERVETYEWGGLKFQPKQGYELLVLHWEILAAKDNSQVVFAPIVVKDPEDNEIGRVNEVAVGNDFPLKAGKHELPPLPVSVKKGMQARTLLVGDVSFDLGNLSNKKAVGEKPVGTLSADEAFQRLPVSKIKDGREKVSLFKIYKVAKWDLGNPNSYSYTPGPDEGIEIFVVRFYREPLTPEQEIAKHAVTVLDTKDRSLHRNEVLWRGAVGAWVEWVFLAVRGTQLKTVIINDTSFNVQGLEIPTEALPLKK